MNTDPVIRTEDIASQPMVQWYPRAGPMRAMTSEVAGAAVIALGTLGLVAIAFGALSLARRAVQPTRLGELEVDRLTVRRLTILDR